MKKLTKNRIANWLLNLAALFISLRIISQTSDGIAQTLSSIMILSLVWYGAYCFVNWILPPWRNQMIIQIFDGQKVEINTLNEAGEKHWQTQNEITKEGYHCIRIWQRKSYEYRYGISINGVHESFPTLLHVSDFVEQHTLLRGSIVTDAWDKLVKPIN